MTAPTLHLETDGLKITAEGDAVAKVIRLLSREPRPTPGLGCSTCRDGESVPNHRWFAEVHS